MNTKIDDKELQKMVFKYLSRVLKNRRLYHKFRCFVGYGENGNNYNMTTTIYSSLISMRKYVDIAYHSSGDNPFFHASTKEDIFRMLSEMTSSENAINKGETDGSKIQMRITQFINTLLHYCVERAVGVSMTERIGQDTFEMVCKDIFGKDFVDESEKNLPEGVRQMIEAQREFMEEHGMDDPRMLSRSSKFLEFLKNKKLVANRQRTRLEEVPPRQMAEFEPHDEDWYFNDEPWL